MNCIGSAVRGRVLVIFVFAIWLGFDQITFADTPPPLPTAFPWSDTNSGTHWFRAETLQDIENAFNAARQWENDVLVNHTAATYLPIAEMRLTETFTLSEWYALSDAERALWLINDARTARGLPEYEGIDPYLSEVTTDYAQLMFDTNTSGHTVGGTNIFDRATDHPEIPTNCPTIMQESIAYHGGTADRTSYFPISIAVYNWIYVGSYGHRTSILYHDNGYVDDTGMVGSEGLIGLGMVEGKEYGGYDGRFSDNVQIIVYNHYDPSTRCANIPAVPVEDNTVIVNEIDYADDGGVSFVELFNTGETSLSLRAYSLLVTGDQGDSTVPMPAVSIGAGDYVVVCSDSDAVERCDHEFEGDITWSEGGQLFLRLSDVAVDTVRLDDDNASSPELGISRTSDNDGEWHARCATPGLQNTVRTDATSPCDLPFASLTQSASVQYDDGIAYIDFAIELLATTGATTGGRLQPQDTPNRAYQCDQTIETEWIEDTLLLGTWTCTAEISLAFDQCTPEIIHQAVVNIDGLDTEVTNEETVLIDCEEPPATTEATVVQSVVQASSGLGILDTQKLEYEISATNSGQREAIFTLATQPAAVMLDYACDIVATQTAAPGETITWYCTGTVSIAYDSCVPTIEHSVTISSDLLPASVVDTHTTTVMCQQLPPYTTVEIEQIVLTAEQSDQQLLLNYMIDVTNSGPRPTAINVTTAGDGLFTSYTCNDTILTDLAPNEHISIICSATVSLEASVCTGMVAHHVTVESEHLVESASDTATTELGCQPIPTAVSTSSMHAAAMPSLLLIVTGLFALMTLSTMQLKP